MGKQIERKKIRNIGLAFLTLILAACLFHAPAARAGKQQTLSAETVQVIPENPGISNAMAARGYINQLLYGYSLNRKADTGRACLEEGSREQIIYDALKKQIQEVAAGTRPSTEFSVPFMTIFGETLPVVTSDEVGEEINSVSIDKAKEIMRQKISFDFSRIIDALLVDCPYELFWYNKTQPTYCNSDGYYTYTTSELSLHGTSYTFQFPVAQEYAVSGETYVFNTTLYGNAAAAAAKADAIVALHKGESDEAMMASFAQEICGLTDYNFDALNPGVQYGNPWQLIWVFDGNEDTKVVCEGYSKAFQFLCDKAGLASARSIIVNGVAWFSDTNYGRHMWNIVRLGGKNYLVDVTNCDIGSSLDQNGPYMIQSSDTGSKTYQYGSETYSYSTYIYQLGSDQYQYGYDEDIIALYGNNALNTLKVTPASHKFPLKSFVKMEPTCTEPGYEAYWECEECGKLFSDKEGENEISAPVPIDPAGHSLGKHDRVAPTCTAAGTEAYWECSSCHNLFSDENGEKGITEPVSIDPTGHSLIKHERIAPTCMAAGTEAYWECSACHNLFSDEKGETGITAPVSINPTGHNWGQPEYVWADDYSSCTAGRVCANDASHSETENGKVSASETPATTEAEGKIVYTATFDNPAFETQTKTKVLPQLTQTDPGQPNQPDQPGQPEQPDQPGQPEQPTQPTQPDQPVQPDQPSQPDQPEQPDQPDTEPPKPPAGEYVDPGSGAAYMITEEGSATYEAPAKPTATVNIPDTIPVQADGQTVEVPVTAIAAGAFEKNQKLTTVSIGGNVTIIGGNAFSSCVKLKTVRGGQNVKEIGNNAFAECRSLKTLPDMPELEKIGNDAFRNCITLTKVKIGPKVKQIGKNAFSGCKKLKTITIQSTLLKKKAIGKNSFKGIAAKATFKCPKKCLKNYRIWLVKPGGAPKTAKFK